MQTDDMRVPRLLSVFIVALAALAAAGGLLLPGLYRDNLFVKSAWKGNDLVTLAVAVPLLIAALWLAKRRSGRAWLVWMGVLDYMLYNYAFYLFGAAFNWFFLIYVALLALSIFALIFSLAPLDAAGIAQRFRARTPIGWIAGYMLLVATGLTVIYFVQSIGFIVSGQLPSIVTRSGHPTSIVFALDLTLLVPFLVLGAVWLLRRKPWGYVLAGIVTVKGTMYTLVLTVGSLLAARAGIADVASELPLWIGLTMLGLIAAALLYGSMQTEPR